MSHLSAKIPWRLFPLQLSRLFLPSLPHRDFSLRSLSHQPDTNKPINASPALGLPSPTPARRSSATEDHLPMFLHHHLFWTRVSVKPKTAVDRRSCVFLQRGANVDHAPRVPDPPAPRRSHAPRDLEAGQRALEGCYECFYFFSPCSMC